MLFAVVMKKKAKVTKLCLFSCFPSVFPGQDDAASDCPNFPTTRQQKEATAWCWVRPDSPESFQHNQTAFSMNAIV